MLERKVEGEQEDDKDRYGRQPREMDWTSAWTGAS